MLSFTRVAVIMVSLQSDRALTKTSTHPQATSFPLYFTDVWLVFFLGGGVRDRVSLYSPGCPGTHFVDQAGLEFRNLPASASQVLGLKACATTPGQMFVFERLASQARALLCQGALAHLLYIQLAHRLYPYGCEQGQFLYRSGMQKFHWGRGICGGGHHTPM